MKCLDTTFLIDFLKNDKSAIDKALELKDEEIFTTSVNIFEVLLGIHRRKASRQIELENFKKLISNFDVLHFDTNSSFIASKITADLISEGREINAMDCLVAGTMLSKNCQNIVTRDAEHFRRIVGIKVITY